MGTWFLYLRFLDFVSLHLLNCVVVEEKKPDGNFASLTLHDHDKHGVHDVRHNWQHNSIFDRPHEQIVHRVLYGCPSHSDLLVWLPLHDFPPLLPPIPSV